jgi:hypothetical protein
MIALQERERPASRKGHIGGVFENEGRIGRLQAGLDRGSARAVA